MLRTAHINGKKAHNFVMLQKLEEMEENNQMNTVFQSFLQLVLGKKLFKRNEGPFPKTHLLQYSSLDHVNITSKSKQKECV